MTDRIYTEGVREFQPRVGFETLGMKDEALVVSTLKGLRRVTIHVNGGGTPSGFRLDK